MMGHQYSLIYSSVLVPLNWVFDICLRSQTLAMDWFPFLHMFNIGLVNIGLFQKCFKKKKISILCKCRPTPYSILCNYGFVSLYQPYLIIVLHVFKFNINSTTCSICFPANLLKLIYRTILSLCTPVLN